MLSFLNLFVFSIIFFPFIKARINGLIIGQEYCLSLDNYTLLFLIHIFPVTRARITPVESAKKSVTVHVLLGTKD